MRNETTSGRVMAEVVTKSIGILVHKIMYVYTCNLRLDSGWVESRALEHLSNRNIRTHFLAVMDLLHD
jgi:hypothetical protein